jgi:hypothetical protein
VPPSTAAPAAPADAIDRALARVTDPLCRRFLEALLRHGERGGTRIPDIETRPDGITADPGRPRT